MPCMYFVLDQKKVSLLPLSFSTSLPLFPVHLVLPFPLDLEAPQINIVMFWQIPQRNNILSPMDNDSGDFSGQKKPSQDFLFLISFPLLLILCLVNFDCKQDQEWRQNSNRVTTQKISSIETPYKNPKQIRPIVTRNLYASGILLWIYISNNDLDSVTISNQQGVTSPMVLWPKPLPVDMNWPFIPRKCPRWGPPLLPSDCNLTSDLKRPVGTKRQWIVPLISWVFFWQAIHNWISSDENCQSY